jgi:uncharacterized membrane protein (UPF0182 family)
VVVAYSNQIAMEPSLEAALARIFGGRVHAEDAVARPREQIGVPAAGAAIAPLVQRAWEAWQKAQEALRRADWTAYGQEQKRLEDVLRQLQGNR